MFLDPTTWVQFTIPIFKTLLQGAPGLGSAPDVSVHNSTAQFRGDVQSSWARKQSGWQEELQSPADALLRSVWCPGSGKVRCKSSTVCRVSYFWFFLVSEQTLSSQTAFVLSLLQEGFERTKENGQDVEWHVWVHSVLWPTGTHRRSSGKSLHKFVCFRMYSHFRLRISSDKSWNFHNRTSQTTNMTRWWPRLWQCWTSTSHPRWTCSSALSRPRQGRNLISLANFCMQEPPSFLECCRFSKVTCIFSRCWSHKTLAECTGRFSSSCPFWEDWPRRSWMMIRFAQWVTSWRPSPASATFPTTQKSDIPWTRASSSTTVPVVLVSSQSLLLTTMHHCSGWSLFAWTLFFSWLFPISDIFVFRDFVSGLRLPVARNWRKARGMLNKLHPWNRTSVFTNMRFFEANNGKIFHFSGTIPRNQDHSY